MPFTSVSELPTNPDVRVFFRGLMILDPNPTPAIPPPSVNTCEVFVHRSAPDHHLSITIWRERAGRLATPIMRSLTPLSFITPPAGVAPRFGMRIRVRHIPSAANPTSDHPKGVRRYDPPDPNNPSAEGEGLGLAIDLEGPQYHNGPLGQVNSLGGRPSLLFNDAVFYTADKTSEQLQVTLRRHDDVVVERLEPFASVIGANIYLDDASNIVLVEWVQEGLPHTLELRKEEGVSYRIEIINEPLHEADGSLLPRHNEFGEYYKILTDADGKAIDERERFELKVPPPDPTLPPPPRGSTTTPCMSVLKGGGGG